MKLSYVLGIAFLTALLSVGVTYLVMHNKNEGEVSETVGNELGSDLTKADGEKKEEFESTVDSKLVFVNTTHAKMLDEWKSGDEPFIDNLLQEVMQDMMHQKIVAETKEGSIMLTPERIDILIQMVEENKDKFEYGELYLEMLNRWKKGDFSTADLDHNTLMYIQHSKTPDGLATGVAVKEQEINYILQVFSKDVDDVFGSTEKK